MIVQIEVRNSVDALQRDDLVGLKHGNYLRLFIESSSLRGVLRRVFVIDTQGRNIIKWPLLDEHLANIALR